MTREEKIKILEKEKTYMLRHGGDTQAEALDSAIKALKQESILENVRAEIEAQKKWLSEAGYNAYNVSIAFESIKHALKK